MDLKTWEERIDRLEKREQELSRLLVDHTERENRMRNAALSAYYAQEEEKKKRFRARAEELATIGECIRAELDRTRLEIAYLDNMEVPR